MDTPPSPGRTYTDEQVTHATGMHIDNLRKLITWRAVRPTQAGGGRGRVRLWSTRQALRISVTAQLMAVGYSLRMAHTLTYCIPLDWLLEIYDPETLRGIAVKQAKELAEGRPPSVDVTTVPFFHLLTTPEQPAFLPDRDSIGAETIIIDGKYLYSDSMQNDPVLVAMIDPEAQSVAPLDDPRGNIAPDSQGGVDLAEIDPASLLIDSKFFKKPKTKRAFLDDLARLSLGTKIEGDSGEITCRSLLVINLALGMTLCVRTLNGLPTEYRPHIASEEPKKDAVPSIVGRGK